MEDKLREYAKLLIEVGLNVQKGQTVVIRCPVECAFFARLCASAAYDVGCTLPLLAKTIGFDPAVMASPFITTVVDAISLMIYFNFASLLLGI